MATAHQRNLLIRHGRAEDAPAVDLLSRAAFDPEFREAWSAQQIVRLLADPGAFMLLAEPLGRLAGFALVRTVAGEAELMLCAVAPGERRQGIARALVARAADEAAARGARRLFLEVRESNHAARAFYEGLGFVLVGVRPGYYRSVTGIPAAAMTLSRAIAGGNSLAATN
ncbi:MAG: GNAT family N-acetyltransferase [Sphingomonadaceae bacterium]